MKKIKHYCLAGSLVFSFLLSSTGCKITPKIGSDISVGTLVDGTYEGEASGGPNSAHVRIKIENHLITSINIISHDAWKGKKAESPIVERILNNQSTNVDAVTGATNSSNVIMNAVQNAVEKAYKNTNQHSL